MLINGITFTLLRIKEGISSFKGIRLVGLIILNKEGQSVFYTVNERID